VTAPAGGATGLVPGATTDVTISAQHGHERPTATVLGANMTIKSLTIADTVNAFRPQCRRQHPDDHPSDPGAGITMNTAVPASAIAANVALGADQTWTNNSANGLTVGGVVSGGYGLTKAGPAR